MDAYAIYLLCSISSKNPENNAMVSDLIDHDARWWKKQLVEEIFNSDEATTIQAILISAMNQPERQVWRGNARGVFTVSSAYYTAKDLDLKSQVEC